MKFLFPEILKKGDDATNMTKNQSIIKETKEKMKIFIPASEWIDLKTS